MRADEQKSVTNNPEDATLTGEESRAPVKQGDEVDREMQREIDRLRRLVNDSLNAIERKLKHRQAS